MRIAVHALVVCLAGMSLLAAAPVGAQSPSLGSGIDLKNISQAISPGKDFYEYINEGWLKKTEIPADRSNYGAFSILDDDTLAAVRQIIEEAAADKHATPGSDRQKVGTFFRNYMNVQQRNQAGIKPIARLLTAIEQLKDKHEVLPLAATLYRQGVGTVLGVMVEPDARRSDQYAVYIAQSGLSMPDRDYYLKPDAKYKAMQTALRSYISDMLTAADVSDAAKKAEEVYELEAKLAEIQWSQVQNRDPIATYNKKSHTELASDMRH